MERMTERCSGGIRIKGCSTLYPNVERKGAPMASAIARLAAYEDTSLTPEDVKRLKEYMQPFTIQNMDRFREIMQAEKDGRLVVLPCKIGDTIYQVDYMTHSEALKSGVPQSEDTWQNRKYGHKRAKYLPLIVREKKMVKTLYPGIGKTVFLTREEAEEALKKREADNEAD